MGDTIVIETPVATVLEVSGKQGPQGVPGPKGDPGDIAGEIAWANITGKPSTFTPSSHTHPISDVSGLQTALDGKQASGNYATLVSGKVPSDQLPSFVDDVVEYANLAAFPVTGDSGKIYVAIDTRKTYRWSGSAYVEISPSEVTSVNGQTGAVTVAAEQHASEHEAGEADEIQATAALVDTDYLPLNGVYFHDGTFTNGRPNFFKTGTRKNTKLQYNSSTLRWNLVRNLTIEAESDEDGYNEPWGQGWIPIGTPTTVSVTRLPLETMVQKLAETGGAATATTSEDGLMSSSDKTKLNGIAAGAEVNVQANWTEADTGSDAFILNKPSTFTPTAHAASHASAGSDPLFDQDLNTTDNVAFDGLRVFSAASQTAAKQVLVADDEGTIVGITGNEADARASLGLGDSATADIGTGSAEVAAGNHSHELTSLAATGATNGHVLTANGSNGATFAALPASGVTGAASSASDVLGVSGANITGVDATADRIVFWDDSASALKYLEAGSGLSISGTTLTATASGGSKTYAVFSAEHNQPPSTAFATLDTRNSIAVLDFDAASDESAVFVGIMPEAASLGSGLIVRLHWMATSATSGNVRWGVRFERSNTDLDSDSFDTAVEATAATNGTSGIITTTAITVTTIDGITAGDVFRLKVFRNADDATNDTMTGDAELVVVEVRSAA